MLLSSQAFAELKPGLQILSAKENAIISLDRVIDDGKVIITVADTDKKPILGLTGQDLSIAQHGRTAKILSVESFEQNLDVPRHMVLVLDNSASMKQRNAVEPLLAAMDEMLKIVRPIDQVHIVVFNDRETVQMGGRDLHVQLFKSSDPAELKNFVNKVYHDRLTVNTVLFEGMLAGLDLVSQMPAEEPKFMVVFSDGEDLNSSFKRDDVSAVARGLDDFDAYAVDYMPGAKLNPFLTSFAEDNGGQSWKATEETNLVPIFQAVASKLQYHYVVNYLFPTEGSLAVSPAQMTIEEIKTIDASPMLGHIYFDLGASELPERYVRLSGQGQTALFNEHQLRGTLEKYYQVLNLLGKRLSDNPGAMVTLVGCNANRGEEKGKQDLSRSRAEAVKAYLQYVWNIAPERVQVEARNLPEKPSTSRLDEGQADNRRTEIHTEDSAVLDLVRSTYVSNRVDTSSLTLKSIIDTAYGIARWSLSVTGGGVTLAELAGEGKPAAEMVVPLSFSDVKSIAAGGALDVTMVVEDRKGQKVTLNTPPVNIRYIQTKERLAQKLDYQVQEKYALILFDFDSAAINDRNGLIVSQIVSRIRELPHATVEIVGHSDNIGKENYNIKLSERRAQAVYDQLMEIYGEDTAERIHHKGVGPNDPLYDNLSPEARAFNRTVTITLEYTAAE
jgi:outer membrane protein OmpA-like peptidoglycan-associated protein